ncbi:hypothetical protein SALBM311S_01271 [Streptomyces alboniger]
MAAAGKTRAADGVSGTWWWCCTHCARCGGSPRCRSRTPPPAGRRLHPQGLDLENYRGIFDTSEFTRALINSIGIALISTVIAVALGAVAAYAVARLRFRQAGTHRHVTADRHVPDVPGVALFNIERIIGIFDTWIGLIIPYMTFSLPLAIYTLSAFFREIPWDLEKAAKVDGATPAQAFRRVIVPLAAPGVFTTAILVFIFCWNDFLFAISLTSTESARTVPAAIAYFTGSSSSSSPQGRSPPPLWSSPSRSSFRPVLPAADRRRTDLRGSQGVNGPTAASGHRSRTPTAVFGTEGMKARRHHPWPRSSSRE